ncbi:hypothetical protein DFJ73DRAFT_796981, partial [Zopfochytrium polystomum]
MDEERQPLLQQAYDPSVNPSVNPCSSGGEYGDRCYLLAADEKLKQHGDQQQHQAIHRSSSYESRLQAAVLVVAASIVFFAAADLPSAVLLALLVLLLLGDAARTFHRATQILHAARTVVMEPHRSAMWTQPRPGVGRGCHDAEADTMVAWFRRIALSEREERWMAEDEILHLIRQRVRFMDVTDREADLPEGSTVVMSFAGEGQAIVSPIPANVSVDALTTWLTMLTTSFKTRYFQTESEANASNWILSQALAVAKGSTSLM